MVVFQRWGVLLIPIVIVGNLVGFGLGKAFSIDNNRVSTGLGMFAAAGLIFLFDKFLLPKLDKPKPMFITEQLPAPVVDASGARMTHRTIPVVNRETGQQVYSRPVSTLFFIPVRFWVFVAGGVGLIFLVLGLVQP